jgi:hypothetical protein
MYWESIKMNSSYSDCFKFELPLKLRINLNLHMKAILINLVRFSSVILMIVMSKNSVAQQDPLGRLVSITEFTIKPGHDAQFRQGVKSWKACYLENMGEWTWRMWQRQQGEGNVYTLASDMANWAEMDNDDEPGNKCQDLIRVLINPHIEKATSHITRFQPSISNGQPADGEIMRVSFYKLNSVNGYKMLEVVKEVEEIRKKAGKTSSGFWYSWITASPESPNYHFVNRYKDYASMDITQENVWEMVENEVGKEKRNELQATFRSSLESTWNYIYKLDKDMSRLSR